MDVLPDDPQRPQRMALREERNLRISTGVAMFAGGGLTLAAGAALGAADPGRESLAWALASLGLLSAVFIAVVFPRASTRGLLILTNVFCVLGEIILVLSALTSGGAGSPYFEMFLFPALYAAYFFSPRVMAAHLTLCSAFILGVVLLEPDPDTPFVAPRLLIVLAGAWAIGAVISWHRGRLLTAEAMARQQALLDPLTGVHNLRSLRAEVEAEPLGAGTGLLLIDVDNFKGVNSHYGHTGADRLLAQIARELTATVGGRACVARIGGDEFAVLVRDRTGDALQALVSACEEATARARAATGLAGPDLSASVGCARWPRDGDDLSSLLDAADHDMLARKRASRRGRVDVAIVGLAAPDRDGPHPALVPDDTPAPPRQERGRFRAWLLAKPPHTLAGVAGWWAAAAAITSVVVLSGGDLEHPGAVSLLAILALVPGALLLVVGARFTQWAYLVSDVTAVTSLVLAIALTGGTTSPMLPFILVPIAINAYFSGRGQAIAQLVVGVVVCATPFIYATADERIDYSVRFVALATTAAVLTLVMARNRRELDDARRSAREQALQDPLTQLPNRRAFATRLQAALADAADAGPIVCAAIIDLDNFKRVNDRHGHAAGDLLLRSIGQALEQTVRTEDTVARVGGDEFAVVAPGTDLDLGRALGERCVAAVEDVAARLGYSDCGVSATVGFALYRRDAVTADGLIAAADTALLRAKDAGKRRVAAAEQPAA